MNGMNAMDSSEITCKQSKYHNKQHNASKSSYAVGQTSRSNRNQTMLDQTTINLDNKTHK